MGELWAGHQSGPRMLEICRLQSLAGQLAWCCSRTRPTKSWVWVIILQAFWSSIKNFHWVFYSFFRCLKRLASVLSTHNFVKNQYYISSSGTLFLANCSKNISLFHLPLTLRKMPKITVWQTKTEFCLCLFWAIRQILNISYHDLQCVLENVEKTRQVTAKRRSDRPKHLFTAD